MWKKKEVLIFQKNLIFIFLLTVSFISFVSFNLLKISLKDSKSVSLSPNKIVKKRGKILDKNNEIVAMSLETKDLYIDVRNSLDRSILKENLIRIFEKKIQFF